MDTYHNGEIARNMQLAVDEACDLKPRKGTAFGHLEKGYRWHMYCANAASAAFAEFLANERQ